MPESRKFTRTASLRLCGVVSPALDSPCPARIINQSPDGLLLELDYQLPVDEVPIKIFLADEMRGTIDYESNNCLVGIIRWCVQEAGSWSGFFQAGVQLVSLAPRKDWR